MTEEGYVGMARWTAQRGWALYKIRPKVHLFGHILLLGIFSIDPKIILTVTGASHS